LMNALLMAQRRAGFTPHFLAPSLSQRKALVALLGGHRQPLELAYTVALALAHWMDEPRMDRSCCAAWWCCRKGAVTSRALSAGAVAGAPSCPRKHSKACAVGDYSVR
jgi:hypothetical protein